MTAFFTALMMLADLIACVACPPYLVGRMAGLIAMPWESDDEDTL